VRFSGLFTTCEWFASVRGRRPVHSGRSGRNDFLALQPDGAARCVAKRPHGDGDGAGQGGRGRALQVKRRVWFLEAASSGRLGSYIAWWTVRPLGAELQECMFSLCRFTALHYASSNGHTETALALVKAGADVHFKSNDGYGFSRQHPRVVGWLQCGTDSPSAWGGAAGEPVLAVQVDSATLCVIQSPHGDGAGAGKGGRGRALQG
jgi:hypothetical protein